VCVVCEPGEPLARASRYVRRSFRWPGGEPDRRVSFLVDLGRRRGLAGWALIPSSDEAAALVARHHARLARTFRPTTPPWSTLRWAYDKRLTHELARCSGVPTPATLRVGPGGVCPPAVPLPAVVKPAVKPELNALTAAKAWPAATREELTTRLAEAVAIADPETLMVQELVPGGGDQQFSYAALCEDGRPLVDLTARRTRQYPADFGRASTFVETVDCPALLPPSRRLLRELGWSGLIELEYKRDARDGVLKLLDMNPRVWGWHTLGGRAGVDFTWALWRRLSGRPVAGATARPGVGWLRLSTDTPTAARELFARRLAVREYARSLRPPRERAIFAWDDPLPGLAELPVLCYVAGRRAFQGGVV
jgi:predicted ATP-grasp superfamily ATP-dependent carboligase